MWAVAPVLIFADEDEAAMRAEFVRLSAMYGHTHSAYDITKHIFKDKRDPDLRSMQAADYWSKDLEILDAIKLTQAGAREDELLQFLWSVVSSPTETTKDRLKAADQIAEVEGRKKKLVDLNLTNGPEKKPLPIFQFAERHDAAGSADIVEPAAA